MSERTEYDVKGDAGFQNIPITSFIGETVEESQCIYVQLDYPLDGSYSNPKKIWESSGGFIWSVGNVGGGIYDISWQEMSGCLNPLPEPPHLYTNLSPSQPIFVYAYISGADMANAMLYVKFTWSDSMPTGTSGSILYKNSYADSQDIIVDAKSWDDSPTDDPDGNFDNMNPIGGEFADTDPFGYGNDEIDLPNTIQEMDYSGFITPYKLDNGGLFALAGGIFSNDTWTTLKNKFNGVGNPIDYIVSAVEIPYSASPDATKNFNLGGVDVVKGNGANVPLPYFTHRYEKLSFGSLTLKETWGTEKDYSGTSVSIYLPYVGVKDLDTAIIMNSTITLSAILDIWSGDLLYVVKINNKSMAYKYLASSGLVYRFQGNCGKQVPIGKVDNSNQLMAMTGSMASMGVGLISGNPMAAFGGAAGLIGSAAMPPKVSMTGGITGAIGRGDTDEPYLIISQSVPVYPKDWRAHFGAPRYQTFTLGDLSGYVKCADVHADSIEGANDAERAAIEQALKAGVFMN